MNNMVSRSPDYISVVSRRYQEWQTLAFKATIDQTDEMIQEHTKPLVRLSGYKTPTRILARLKEKEETKEKEIKMVNEEDRRRSQSPTPCMPVEKIHKTEDEDRDRTNMLFEKDRERILVNEVIRDRTARLHRPYSCQSDELWARDGVSQKRNKKLTEVDAATSTMDGLRGEDCNNVSSSVKITAITMAGEEEEVLSEPMNTETKVEETATKREDPRDSGSDHLLSHHLGDKIKMGDFEEHS